MMYFRNFNAELWGIFVGHLLLLFCCIFYLAWWIVTFRPNASVGPTGVCYITAAFITGIAAVALLCWGIAALSKHSESIPVWLILVGVAALFVVLLLLTTMVFQRIVTSELLIILVWTGLELSAITVLFGTGRFGPETGVILAVLVGIVTVVSLICYVLYYHLDETLSYWIGMVPLTFSGLFCAAFLGVLAFL
ncbi:hypothetical protein GH810_14725 [Acetobacterium paludosum]|uniref:Uncharacterized protein n=1 Tax=Acetobacterium paludosum TaxID=52693 RepID=A0A923KXG5_9FIRM|nr:hypothetical protein [Acetobacterium paludosum]MBC3889565.1 hypothetical protein [Acetobacterium paludosum]